MTLRTLVVDLDKLDAAGLAASKAAAIIGRTANAEMVTAMLDEATRVPELVSAAERLKWVSKRLLDNPSLHYPHEETLTNYHCRRTGTPQHKVKDIGLIALRALPDAADQPPPPPAAPTDTVGAEA